MLHAANIQDRDGGILLFVLLFKQHPDLRKLYADGGHRGPTFRRALRRVLRKTKVELVKCSDTVSGFAMLRRLWAVERTIGWLNRRRRLAKDWESRNRNGLAFLYWAAVRIMLRKLCKVTRWLNADT